MSRSIRILTEEFLNLVREGCESQEQNEATLDRLLDELALARHDVSFKFDPTEYPDAPDWPYEERRALVSERFPNYGMYNVVLSLTEQVGRSEPAVGDAIDDIADIAGDLAEVAWAWEHTSEANALWYFENSFTTHMGEHLRHLQLYLYSRE